MAFVIGPSRNKTLQAAWEGLRKQQRAEKKAAEPEAAPTKKAAVKRPAVKKAPKPTPRKGPHGKRN